MFSRLYLYKKKKIWDAKFPDFKKINICIFLILRKWNGNAWGFCLIGSIFAFLNVYLFTSRVLEISICLLSLLIIRVSRSINWSVIISLVACFSFHQKKEINFRWRQIGLCIKPKHIKTYQKWKGAKSKPRK